MKRRTVLAVAAAGLGGCLAPAQPPTDQYPSTPPTVFATFDYRPASPAYEVRFRRGNRLTRENTGAVLIDGDTDTGPLTWVSQRRDDAVATFPVEPGDSVRYPVDRRTDVRLIWEAPDEGSAVVLAVSGPPETEDRT